MSSMIREQAALSFGATARHVRRPALWEDPGVLLHNHTARPLFKLESNICIRLGEVSEEVRR